MDVTKSCQITKEPFTPKADTVLACALRRGGEYLNLERRPLSLFVAKQRTPKTKRDKEA